MEEMKSLSVGVLSVGDMLFKLNSGELGCVDYALGTPKQWFADIRSDSPDWRVILISPRQVLALRVRA